jgi:hypothetical protein
MTLSIVDQEVMPICTQATPFVEGTPIFDCVGLTPILSMLDKSLWRRYYAYAILREEKYGPYDNHAAA